jgi:hypothetical protein
MTKQLDNIEEMVEKIFEAVYGNGKPGLRLDVDRLKTFVRGLKWSIGVVIVAGVGAIVRWIIR